MSYNLELTERVRDILADTPNVEERKMFGSIGFKVNGKLCLGVGDHDDHQLMVRVGPNAYSDALKQPGAHPAIMREREMKGYVFVTGDGLTKEGSLEYWVKLAVTFNTQLTKQDA